MRFVSPISAVCVLSVSAYFTQAHAQTHTFNISAHTFSDALAAFQKQSGLSVLANTEDTRHLSGPYVVSGKMSDVEALKQLVKKGSFTVHQSSLALWLSRRPSSLKGTPNMFMLAEKKRLWPQAARPALS